MSTFLYFIIQFFILLLSFENVQITSWIFFKTLFWFIAIAIFQFYLFIIFLESLRIRIQRSRYYIYISTRPTSRRVYRLYSVYIYIYIYIRLFFDFGRFFIFLLCNLFRCTETSVYRDYSYWSSSSDRND